MSDTPEWLELCDSIADVFKEKLREIFQKEEDEDDYMKQTILGSKFRAFIAIIVCFKDSYKSMVNILSLAIAKHRAEVHDDGNEKEVEKIEEASTDEEIEVASTKGWSN